MDKTKWRQFGNAWQKDVGVESVGENLEITLASGETFPVPWQIIDQVRHTPKLGNYRKKPVTIQAVQWDGTALGAAQILGLFGSNGGVCAPPGGGEGTIFTTCLSGCLR